MLSTASEHHILAQCVMFRETELLMHEDVIGWFSPVAYFISGGVVLHFVF